MIWSEVRSQRRAEEVSWSHGRTGEDSLRSVVLSRDVVEMRVDAPRDPAIGTPGEAGSWAFEEAGR